VAPIREHDAFLPRIAHLPTRSERMWRATGSLAGLAQGFFIPLFFVTTNAWILWIVVPLVVSRWRHIHRRRRNREAAPGPGDTGHGDTGHGDTGPGGSAPG
jgi:hypothetical protein